MLVNQYVTFMETQMKHKCDLRSKMRSQESCQKQQLQKTLQVNLVLKQMHKKLLIG